MHDIVIRNGTIVDGSGAPKFVGDIAIDGDRIAAVGVVAEKGAREIDATGKVVAPGFVDIHTHYDGQATWDAEMAPSSWHGVTTVVMGNCGVGFAPARPDSHEWLIGLMEGVEDIPGAALAEGLTWDWETFPEYLDALDRKPRTVDVGCLVPHGTVRAYVMGDRCVVEDLPTDEEMAEMARIVGEGMNAGALGFSTSRTQIHRSIDGELVPGSNASKAELMAIGRGMAKAGKGIFEITSDLKRQWDEFGWMSDLSRETGQPVLFSLAQTGLADMTWREQMISTVAANARGGDIKAQFASRGIGVMMGWQTSVMPFAFRPAWLEMTALPWEEKLARLRDPAVRRRMIDEVDVLPEIETIPEAFRLLVTAGFTIQYEMDEDFNYEPTDEDSVVLRAARSGVSPAEYAYDMLMKDDGTGFIYMPFINYVNGNLDFVKELIERDDTIVSLSDGGAHCGTICDAATPTFLLAHWSRDRPRGTVSIEKIISKQCRETAVYFGLEDRGLLAPGLLADLNIIDYDRLKLGKPWLASDLPAGGKRLLQRAQGYAITIKSGEITFEEGVPTGNLPGRLVRGRQTVSAPKVGAPTFA